MRPDCFRVFSSVYASVLLALCLAACQSHSAEFHVEGSLAIQVSRHPPNRPSQIDCSFDLSWRDCNWIIRSKRSDQQTDYEEDGYDGTNIYSFSSLEGWVQQRRAKGLPVGKNLGQATITPGAVPYRSPEVNQVLWMLYASSCFLSRHPGTMPRVAVHGSRHAYLYFPEQPANWRKSDGLPGLPAYAALFSDGRMYKWKDEDAGFMGGPPDELQWPPPYDKGFTNALLIVKQFYRERDYAVPMKAVFTVHAPRADGASSNDLEVLRSYTIGATNSSLRSDIYDFKPKIGGEVLVMDRRFERAQSPVYELTYSVENRWLTDEQVRQRPEFQKIMTVQRARINISKASSQISNVRVGQAKFFVRVGAMVSLIGLALIIAKVKRKKEN